MNKHRRWAAPIATLALVLAAGCSSTGGSAQSAVRRYSITVHETQQAGGLGPSPVREATLTATMQQHQGKLVFFAVDSRGDPGLAASARALEGRTLTLDRASAQAVLSGYGLGDGLLPPADAAVLFQSLVPPQSPPGASPRSRPLQLGTGTGQVTFQAQDAVTGHVDAKGVPAQQVTTTARVDRRLGPIVAYVRLSSTYAADRSFQDLFAAPPSLALATTTQTVTVPGSSSNSLLNLFGALFNTFGCVLTLGQICNTGAPAPSQVTQTVAVPGPASLQATLAGNITLTSTQQLARQDGTLLTAAGTGRMEVSGPR